MRSSFPVGCPGDSWSIKSQAPSSKLQRTPKTKDSKTYAANWRLGIGSALGFGAWSLVIDTLVRPEESTSRRRFHLWHFWQSWHLWQLNKRHPPLDFLTMS